MELVFTESDFETLTKLLLSDQNESCAVLLARQATTHGRPRLLVIEHFIVPREDYAKRSEIAATIRPEFFVPLVKRARDERLVVVFVHTHPQESLTPKFSSLDDEGERELGPFLAARVPDLPHTALVLASTGYSARVMLTGEVVDVVVTGSRIVRSWSSDSSERPPPVWDRQVRAFGLSGQRIMRATHVGVVGCGGTGSIVAQQLAHLGVSNILLIDPDVIEVTNLNRVVGASISDIGRLKVDVAARSILSIGIGTSVTTISKSVLTQQAVDGLLSADAVFSCTDSHGSRALLNQIAYQYYLPVFDVGVSITAVKGAVTHITGRAQMLGPGLGCLVCAQALDWVEVRRDFQTEEERRADPYITGAQEPQPAVITLNGTMSSLLATMFLAAFTGVPAGARLQYYDGIAGTIRSAAVRPQPGCVVCSMSGVLGQGDRSSLPVRAE